MKPPACCSQGLAVYSEKRQALQHLGESNLSAAAILMTSAVSPKERVFSCQQEAQDKTFGKASNTSLMMDNSGKGTHKRSASDLAAEKNSFQLNVLISIHEMLCALMFISYLLGHCGF